MKVKSTIPHYCGQGELHPEGHVYELTAEPELSLRLKDYIVVPVENPPAVPPSVFTPVSESQ